MTKMRTAPSHPVVLTVNDDRRVLELLGVLLEHEGYRVVTAESASRALELVPTVEPDIVISDVVMPEIDGLELCRRLKQNPRTAFLPVMLVSALRKTEGDSLHGLVAGADDYLEIPFRRQELLVKVARLTERHRVERHYREIVEQAADIIYTRDMQGRLTSINEAGARFFGRPASELVGLHLSDLLGIESADDIASTSHEEESDEPARSVHPVRDVDGVLHYLEAMTTLVRDAAGEPIAVRGVVRDITELKQAEGALREGQRVLSTLMSNLPGMAYRCRNDRDWTMEFASEGCVELTGYSPSDLVGNHTVSYAELIHPDDEQMVWEAVQTAIAEQRAFQLNYRIRTVTGEERWVWEQGRGVFDEAGELICIEGFIADITERKRAEAAVRESEERYRELFENANDIIYTHDLKGNFTSLNKSGELITGYTREEAVRMNIADILAPEQLETARAMMVRKEQENVSTLYQLEVINKQGGRVSLEVSTRLIYQDGVAVGVQGVARDITERQRAAKALAEQAEREALINRISNSVRSSLDISEVFSTAVRELGLHLGVDRCSVYMQQEDGRLARNMAEYHAPGVQPAPRDFPLTQGKELIAGIQQNGVLSFSDAAHDERISHFYQRFLRPAGVRSIIYVAIKVGEQVPAAFALSTTRELRHWSDTDIALAKAVAIQTGIAIRQAELYRKAEATSAREGLINRLSLAIRASLSLPEVLRTATRELGRALNASHVYLRLYDPAAPRSPVEHEYVAPGASSLRHVDVSFDSPVGRHLLRTTQPLIISDALRYTDGSAELSQHIRTHATVAGVRAQVDWPLLVNGNFRGVLCIHQTNRVRHWTEDELALVEAVASQLATGIAQAELFELTKRAKKEWETTFNAMSDGIFIFDRSGQLIRVNRAGAAMEDTWPHLLLGRHCCDILRTNMDERFCIVESTLTEGRGQTIEVTPERFNRPLLVTAEPLIESDNMTVGVVCTARDLSELRKVEARAREHQSLLMNILESAREAIYAVDTEGYFQWCNSATIAAMGGRAEDLIGHHFLETTFEADRQLAAEHFAKVVNGKPQSYEARFSGRDGQLRYALIDNAPIVVEGRTTAVLGIARDITEQKQERERAAQADKLRALGQLASGVAHDFNNALAAILGRAQLMRRDLHDKRLIQNLDIIQTAAEDAAATVRRIQTFARRSEAQEFDLLDVGALLRDAVEITRTRWENEASMRGLFYEVEVETEEQLYVSGNASELREVFVNLIVNAVDAMPRGGQILISGHRRDERTLLCFADSGTGMTEEVRKRIFEPFYTTKGAQGTGLGLAVSYGIIQRHKGDITVTSKPGMGTTFEIDLPAAVPAPVVSGERLVGHETPPLRVLVIDDEDFVRETLADMLTALGHEVSLASGGAEALAELDSKHFELVFTDLSMPGMDGWEVAREIRRRFGSELSIVLVTGYGKTTALPPGEQDLVNGVIGKPFDFDHVAQTIAQVSQRSVMKL